MTGKGQHIRQEASEKTAEEYRATADEHTQTLKDFWKRFMVSGLFVMAAIVIILACLAWFLNNSQVNAGGVNVSAAGAKLALVAASDGEDHGYYERTPEERQQLNFDISSSMTVTSDSNLNNKTAGTLYPGARGQIKFKVQPLTNDLNGATINISRVLQLEDENKTLVKESDYAEQNTQQNTQQTMPDVLKLAKGHLLFFTRRDNNGFYSNHVTDSIDIPKSEFCEGGDTTKPTTKSVDVVLSWVWPEYLQNFVYTGNANYYKNLFVEANSDYTAMQTYVNGHKTYFYNGYSDGAKIPDLTSTMKSADLGQCADYYNKADDYLGNNVAYFQLQLSADETPQTTGGTGQ